MPTGFTRAPREPSTGARRSSRAISRLRVAALRAIIIAWLTALGGQSSADEAVLPVVLQIELMLKVARYDKNLPRRAGDRVRIGLLIKAGVDEAARAAFQAQKVLSQTDRLLELPIETNLITISESASIGRQVREQHLALIYVAPGFSEAELSSLAASLEGISVLSAGAVPSYVVRGTVLGFDLVGGKPKLLFNKTRAKKQDVQFSADVLRLMKVIE